MGISLGQSLIARPRVELQGICGPKLAFSARLEVRSKAMQQSATDGIFNHSRTGNVRIRISSDQITEFIEIFGKQACVGCTFLSVFSGCLEYPVLHGTCLALRFDSKGLAGWNSNNMNEIDHERLVLATM
jgi:hypothetical protein